ncbi:unnamed protein product, partial [Citrullus colocynthis]
VAPVPALPLSSSLIGGYRVVGGCCGSSEFVDLPQICINRRRSLHISVTAPLDVTLCHQSAARLGVAAEAASPMGLAGQKWDGVGG